MEYQSLALQPFCDFAFHEFSSSEVLEPSTVEVPGRPAFYGCTVFPFQDFLIVTLREYSSVPAQTFEIYGFTVIEISGFRISVQSHTAEFSVFTVCTFSGFHIFVKSGIFEIAACTGFAFSGFPISVK
jgi:hypothetical protein